jgi:hypothetical protein
VTSEYWGLTTREPEKSFYKIIVVIRDSLSDIAMSDNGEDGEEENDDGTEQGKPSEDDEPGWVMGTISETVQHRMKRYWQKQMKLDELTQPGWGEAADYCCERDKKYGTAELRVQAVVKPQTNYGVAAPALTTFGELMECLDIVPRRSQILQGTSRPGSTHMRVGSGMPQSDTCIPGLGPTTEVDSSPMVNAKPIEPVSIYPCTTPPQLITIWISDLDQEMVTAPASVEE